MIVVEQVPLDALRLDSKNARRHTPRNLDAITASLNRFGQRKPVILWGDVVIAGNGTVQAAKALGWTEVSAARVPDDWTEEQARGYAIADNRTGELADWDTETLAETLQTLDAAGWDVNEFGWTVDEVDDMLAWLEETADTVVVDAVVDGSDRPGDRGATQEDSYADFLDRYRRKTVRFIMLEYPIERFTWITAGLAKVREDRGLDSNAAAVADLLSSYLGEPVPDVEETPSE